MSLVVLFLSLFLMSQNGDAAIFGDDDRVSILPNDANDNYGRATAVAVLSSLIEPDSFDSSTYQISTDSLEGYMCKDQKFFNMPSLSYACSGFLVAPDLIVTAGHCMVNVGSTENEEEMYCDAYGWLFDYQLKNDGSVEVAKIPAEKYYRCKKIIFAINQDLPYKDFALVQLDRPVLDRKPLKLSAEAPKSGDAVSMIGYPMGVPMVVSPKAIVSLNLETQNTFITNLDALEGNSGSAVFNSKNEVIGILVAGTPYIGLIDVTDPRQDGNTCTKYNVCDNEGKHCTEGNDDFANLLGELFQRKGSEVQKIKPIIDLINATKKNTERYGHTFE